MFKYIFRVSVASLLAALSSALISNLSELPLDSNGHLESHWLLTSEGCNDLLSTVKHSEHLIFRKHGVMDESLTLQFLNKYSPCVAASIEKGTPGYQLMHVLPQNLFSGISNFESWLRDLRKAEVGFMHFNSNPVDVMWIDGGRKVKLANIAKGERHTFWTQSYLGHMFELIDEVTKNSLGTYIIECNSFFTAGDPGVHTRRLTNEIAQVRNTFFDEYERAKMVTRTFTKLGFNKGRLPPDLFASIEAYYYNNMNHLALEEWHNKGGVHVNWYEVPAYMIQMPWELKRTWQTRLKELVETWIGNIPLENTDIYGIRQYQDGARLISHVDRINTHAASLIINVAQGKMREPWYIEIYDHAGRLHEITMNPGDIVYYESASCLHGRMKPLNGSHYVNIFSHYRPVGDSEWYLRPNPPGTPEPLIDIGDCKLNRDHCENPSDENNCRARVKCDKADLPTLSPSLETVHSGQDLFNYWEKYSHKTPPVNEIVPHTVGTKPLPKFGHSEL